MTQPQYSEDPNSTACATAATSTPTTLAAVNLLVWAMIAYETVSYDDRRYRLRHGLEPEPTAPLGGGRT